MNILQRLRLRAELNAWNAAQQRAREEYAAHPSVAVEEDWCVACCYPRRERRCAVCSNTMAQRARRDGGAA